MLMILIMMMMLVVMTQSQLPSYEYRVCSFATLLSIQEQISWKSFRILAVESNISYMSNGREAL